jgi:ubiquinone/menaquinone biosynthesis C-methylase UbiE
MSDQQIEAFREFERAGWNEVAEEYARVSRNLTPQAAGPLLDAAQVTSGDRVLDVASGPGWVAAEAAGRGADATGLDISASMVEGARRRHPTITFEVGSAEEMPFEDGSFDAVVSAFGMPHFADHAAVFAEVRRVLRPSGRLAVASWNPPATNPFFAVALGAIAQCGSLDVDLPVGVDMFTWADDDACRELFSRAGLGPHTRTPVDLLLVSDDGPAEVVKVLDGASVRSRALFHAQAPEAKVAIVEKIGELLGPMERDGMWTITASAFVLSAESI